MMDIPNNNIIVERNGKQENGNNNFLDSVWFNNFNKVSGLLASITILFSAAFFMSNLIMQNSANIEKLSNKIEIIDKKVDENKEEFKEFKVEVSGKMKEMRGEMKEMHKIIIAIDKKIK